MEPGPETKLRDGRYVIVGKLGEGAQGTTFDAVDQLVGRPVAIKRFSVRGAASWKDVELAEREAKVLEVLSHPALPAHIEHFEEDGALYLVMEKIDGETLAARAKRPGATSREDVVRFLRDVGGVLDYLHGRSPPVIHRDINPKNVIRRPDGSHAIVDFGAVRDKLKPEGGSTVVGTFGYMAPEQFQGRALPASDVYAVGATALRLLTGTDPEDLPHKGLAIDVRLALGTGFDPALCQALERMLEIDPDRRARSIAEALKPLDAAPREPGRAPSGSSRQRERAGNGHWDMPGKSRLERDWEEWAGSFKADMERDWGELSGKSRKERRRMQRQLRRSRRHRRGPPPAFLALGLNMAILVVAVVLGFAVPLLLWLLSIPFGKGLREAAENVKQAGRRAEASMRAARDRLLGREAGPSERGERAEEAVDESHVRVEGDAPRPPPRSRVKDEGDGPEIIDVEGTDVDEPVGRNPRRPRAGGL